MYALFWSVLHKQNKAQIIVSLTGSEGSGKSTLINVLRAIVGDSYVLTTTLSFLNANPFELSNVKDKKLILI